MEKIHMLRSTLTHECTCMWARINMSAQTRTCTRPKLQSNLLSSQSSWPRAIRTGRVQKQSKGRMMVKRVRWRESGRQRKREGDEQQGGVWGRHRIGRRQGDSGREGARLWEMDILYNLKWFPLPSFLYPVLCALSLPQCSHAVN